MKKIRRGGCLGLIAVVTALMLVASGYIRWLEWPVALVVAGFLVGIAFLLEGWMQILFDDPDDRHSD